MINEKTEESFKSKKENNSFLDYVALGISTVGVGYIPIAPGTWGSAVGVLIYLIIREFEVKISSEYIHNNFHMDVVNNWTYLINAVLLLILCLVGFWAAGRAALLFKIKDPKQVVIDEVMGQLITFLFIPFAVSWKFILSGFLLFRLFDIWKPYPVRSLEDLPGGLGICMDDNFAGVYAGICLLLLYTIEISFF